MLGNQPIGDNLYLPNFDLKKDSNETDPIIAFSQRLTLPLEKQPFQPTPPKRTSSRGSRKANKSRLSRTRTSQTHRPSSYQLQTIEKQQETRTLQMYVFV